MKARNIFVNLPVSDLKKSRAFWSELGFSFNEQFSDDNAICLILNEECMFAMLIGHEMFATFTNRPIADNNCTQVLLAIDVGSREKVDELVGKALQLGATRYRNPEDHGWMYYDTFADPDGHQWEFMFADLSNLPQAVQ
jgi:predicted lactoylglutathione lyase